MVKWSIFVLASVQFLVTVADISEVGLGLIQLWPSRAQAQEQLERLRMTLGGCEASVFFCVLCPWNTMPSTEQPVWCGTDYVVIATAWDMMWPKAATPAHAPGRHGVAQHGVRTKQAYVNISAASLIGSQPYKNFPMSNPGSLNRRRQMFR